MVHLTPRIGLSKSLTLFILPLLSYAAAFIVLNPYITHAAGNTYHVRQDGGGDCTTIQECVNKVQGPGDTVIVHGGTYGNFSGSLTLPSPDGDAGNPITVRAAGDGVVWSLGGLDMWENDARYWVIDGINFDRGYWPNNCAGKPDDIACRTIVAAVSSFATLKNLEIKNASYYGIAMGSDATFINVSTVVFWSAIARVFGPAGVVTGTLPSSRLPKRVCRGWSA
jgi:hypothetical protein